jgi:hypothetical protein
MAEADTPQEDGYGPGNSATQPIAAAEGLVLGSQDATPLEFWVA